MDRIFKVDIKIVFMIFVILDIFCVSLGMGVPFFCILFGLPVGWYSAKRIIVNSNREKVNFILKKTLHYALATSIFTVVDHNFCFLFNFTKMVKG
jgi:hypothetical protein